MPANSLSSQLRGTVDEGDLLVQAFYGKISPEKRKLQCVYRVSQTGYNLLIYCVKNKASTVLASKLVPALNLKHVLGSFNAEFSIFSLFKNHVGSRFLRCGYTPGQPCLTVTSE